MFCLGDGSRAWSGPCRKACSGFVSGKTADVLAEMPSARRWTATYARADFMSRRQRDRRKMSAKDDNEKAMSNIEDGGHGGSTLGFQVAKAAAQCHRWNAARHLSHHIVFLASAIAPTSLFLLLTHW